MEENNYNNNNNLTEEISFEIQNSPNNFFKSSFARSFVINYRDTKCLNNKFIDTVNIDDEMMSSMENVSINSKNNKYLSPIDVDDDLINNCENKIKPIKKNEVIIVNNILKVIKTIFNLLLLS